jgi:uncharacterized protein YndB with AHSA1/START domain
MKTWRSTLHIRATPEVVWQLLTDAPGYPSWNPEVTRIEGTIGPGETFVVHKGDETKVATIAVGSFEPPRRLVLETTAGLPRRLLEAKRTYTLAPDADGVELVQELVFTGMMSALVTRSLPDQEPVLAGIAAALKARAEQA